MNSLTPFGRFLRMLRLNRNETLKDMTEQLAEVASYTISPAFLSAVELGRKNVATDLIEAVARTYKLDASNQEKLRDAAEESAQVVKIRPTSETRTLVTQFARRFEELDQREVAQILSVLNASKGNKQNEPA